MCPKKSINCRPSSTKRSTNKIKKMKKNDWLVKLSQFPEKVNNFFPFI